MKKGKRIEFSFLCVLLCCLITQNSCLESHKGISYETNIHEIPIKLRQRSLLRDMDVEKGATTKMYVEYENISTRATELDTNEYILL